jgi:ribosomal silencing factor RsfS
MDTMTYFIIVTGNSTRHLKKMSDMVVRTVRHPVILSWN